MSRIDKLQILGVRSFDNTRAEVIQFHTPLTLIVGLNGSGKTTIIECLKYITTGDLPPNATRGGAFIHDPKLAGEKDVYAQVKLAFMATSGAKMVATRNLQLTVKKTTRTQKSLEGSLMMIRGGEKTSVSTRVAELDQILPQYLGVSKAILDSVIFCHQEESLWPLSEPAALKKRFDEIFEAMKYTKAIENIKLLRKKQNEELGKFKIMEQHAKEDKDKAERDQKRMDVLYDEIEKLRAEAVELTGKVDEAKAKSESAWEHAAQFQSIVSKLNGKRMQGDLLQKSVNELKDYIKEMTDSDEDLQSMQDRYEERMAIYEQEVETQKRRYRDLSQDLEETRRALGQKQAELGKFEAQKEQFHRQIAARESLIKDIASKHSIYGFEFDLDDEKVRDFTERLRRLSREKQAELDKARRDIQEKVTMALQELGQWTQQRSVLLQKKEGARTQISANDSKIDSLQNQMDGIEADEGAKSVLESAVSDVEQKLARAKAEMQKADWDVKLKEADTELRSLDEAKEQLDTELIQGTKQAGDSARLDYLYKEVKGRQQSLDTMISTHGSRISKCIEQDSVSPDTLERSYQTVLDEKSSSVRETEAKRDSLTRELQQVEFKMQTAKRSLDAKIKERSENEAKVLAVLPEDVGVADYPEEVEELTSSVQIQKADRASFGEMRKYYQKCLETAKDDSTCRLCERRLKDGREVNKFVEKMEKMIARALSETVEEEIKQAEEDLNQVNAVRANYEIWKRLNNEIPPVQAELKELEKKRDDVLAKIDEQERVIRQAIEAKKDVESFSKTVQTITKYHAEINNFNAQIKELEGKRRELSTMSRALEVIQDEIRQVNEQQRMAKSRFSQLTSDKERGRSQINTLELEGRDIKSRLDAAVYQLKEKSALASHINELKKHNSAHRESVQSWDSEIHALAPRIMEAEATVDEIRRAGEETESGLRKEFTRLSESNNQLQLADQEITAYTERGGDAPLERARREVEHMEDVISNIETEQRQVTSEAKKLEDQLKSHGETKRAISDNLRYRQSLRELQVVKEEIEELEGRNAEDDKNRYEQEGAHWSEQRNRLASEQATIIGELKEKDNQLTELMKIWKTDHKDASFKYKESHIRVETTKAAVEDLGRYGTALDKAIMKYHAVKMEEINRIIEELWRKTYQGTDIDTIMIKSDNDNPKQGSKSYNYRVVMVKDDTEMDMRGRCSAGQKVLASILIRLALAECFGVNCGLITLDEPTTNLDIDNIRALAESLHEIIKVRRQQANFQLIVITHDEEFLKYMHCADFADSYFRVSRNDRQKSIIEKQSIAEVV